MANNSKHNVLISTGYIKQINKLSGDQAKNLLLAICAYQEEQEMPELDPVTDMLFSFMQAEIDDNNARYEAICAKNRENGAKGGRPSKTPKNPTVSETEEKNPTVTNETQRNPKNPDSDSDYDNDIDNDIDIVIESPNGDSKEKVSPKGDTKKKTAKNPKQKKPKFPHGEYQHVLLTDDEFFRLANDLGQDMRDECIKFLDEYIEEKGYKSKSHNLSIRRWVVGAVNEHKNKASPKDSMQRAIEMFMGDET